MQLIKVLVLLTSGLLVTASPMASPQADDGTDSGLQQPSVSVTPDTLLPSLPTTWLDPSPTLSPAIATYTRTFTRTFPNSFPTNQPDPSPSSGPTSGSEFGGASGPIPGSDAQSGTNAGTPGSGGQCTAGEAMCCQSVTNPGTANQELGGVLGDVIGTLAGVLVGIHCSPLSAIGAECPYTSACCSPTTLAGGLVNVGCVPPSVNV